MSQITLFWVVFVAALALVIAGAPRRGVGWVIIWAFVALAIVGLVG